MAEKLFSQQELNRIVAARVKRERDRLTKEYESSLKRCMAAVHLILHEEMCTTLKREMTAETKDPLWSGLSEKNPQEKQTVNRSSNPNSAAGEVKANDRKHKS